MTYSVTRMNAISEAVNRRLVQFTPNAAFEFAMWNLLWDFVDTVAGEWGCCHNKEDVLNGECSRYHDDAMPKGMDAFALLVGE